METPAADDTTALSELIENGTRAEIARGYAAEILARQGHLMHGPQWAEWNLAIIERFGMKGIDRIKREAWRLVDEHER